MLIEALQQNGFSEKEARVYIAILEGGEVPISRIAQKANLKRTTIYSIIESLKSRGVLTTQMRKGMQYFSALQPTLLIERFRGALAVAEQALPLLMEMSYASPVKPQLRFAETLDECLLMLRDLGGARGPAYVYLDPITTPKSILDACSQKLFPQRQCTGCHTSLLLMRPEPEPLLSKAFDAAYGSCRTASTVPLPASPMVLFGENTLILFSFGTEGAYGCRFESTGMFNTLRSLFLTSWAHHEPAPIRKKKS